ncbi:MAG: hypothetical protein JKY83_09435 [Rhizobiaceae bacterium]|nr:hypothetical protein [Rhizobiaceae bacterium]
MSISATGRSGGFVLPKGVVPMRLIDHPKFKLALIDEDQTKRIEMALKGLNAIGSSGLGRKADNHPDNLWGTIELQNQTVKIYKTGVVETQGGIHIDWHNIDGAQNRADAILSKYGGRFEKIAHQQEFELIPQGPTKFQSLLDEQFALFA